MSKKCTAEHRTCRQDRGTCGSETKPSQRTLAVLCLTHCGPSVSPGTIKALCEGIPGVGALHVDVARSRIHVLYDGTATDIAEVMHAARLPGLDVRLLEDSPLRAQTANGSP